MGSPHLPRLIQHDDALFQGNRVECPVRFGVTSCPEWKNSVTDHGGLSYCIHPKCNRYLGRGGAIFSKSVKVFDARGVHFVSNVATSGGCIYAQEPGTEYS